MGRTLDTAPALEHHMESGGWRRDRGYARFYGEGKNLGELAQLLDCSIHDLSPWLTAPEIRIAVDAVGNRPAAPNAAQVGLEAGARAMLEVEPEAEAG